MGDKSLYGVLEVSRDASAEVIDAAYRSLRERHEALAVQGNEAALARLKAAKEAFTVLSDPSSKARYDLSLRRREASVAPAPVETPGAGRFVVPALVILVLFGSGWGYVHQHTRERERLTQELRAKEQALANAEAERLQRERDDAAKLAEQQRRLDQVAYERWREQSRRDGITIQQRNDAERARAEREEARQRQIAERRQQTEQQIADAAARRRLEEEKARLRRLQYENGTR